MADNSGRLEQGTHRKEDMMSAKIEQPRLSFVQKLGRFKDRMRDPEWRLFGTNLLLGKFLGLLALGAVLLGLHAIDKRFTVSTALADTPAACTPNPPTCGHAET